MNNTKNPTPTWCPKCGCNVKGSCVCSKDCPDHMNNTKNPTTRYRISHVTGYGAPNEDGICDVDRETLELTIGQLRELIPQEVDVQWLLTSGSLGEHSEWVLLPTPRAK